MRVFFSLVINTRMFETPYMCTFVLGFSSDFDEKINYKSKIKHDRSTLRYTQLHVFDQAIPHT